MDICIDDLSPALIINTVNISSARDNKFAASSEKKGVFKHVKMCRFRSSCACAKYHPGLCTPFLHSVVSKNAVSEGTDQTARMCRLIWAFAVRICPKTRFRKARPRVPNVLWNLSFLCGTSYCCDKRKILTLVLLYK